MSCYRVPIEIFRRDAKGHIRVVPRPGPIIDAPDARLAKARTVDLMGDWPDVATIGEPVLLHERWQHRTGLNSKLRPISRAARDERSLTDEGLARLLANIRRRRVA